MIYIGVDPGQKGGYAVIGDQTALAYPWDDELFIVDMKAVLHMNQPVVAAVEKVGARPGQGVTSMFNFGKSAGYIEGVLAALGISHQLVPPHQWKRDFGLIGQEKLASVMVCQRLFPAVDLRRTERCTTYSDGKAEALLIAEYARRHYGRGSK